MTTADDDKLIAYLKTTGTYAHLATAAGLAKDATVSDVHVPAAGAQKKPAPVGQKPEEEAEALEKRLSIEKRAMQNGDVVFAKGQANLYVSRPVAPASAQRLYAWAVEQGIKNIVPPELMHTTQVHSTAEVDTDKLKPLSTVLEVGATRWLTRLGKEGKALVMMFTSPEMQERFKEALAAGASWDFPNFIPHITISYDTEPPAAPGEDWAPDFWQSVPPPDMPLQLGPEHFQASNDNWVGENQLTKADEFTLRLDVQKALPDQQLIFGWASISTVNGVEVVDKQDDIIPIVHLEKAAYDFTLYSRQHGSMHELIGTGSMVESMVFTAEKRALGIIAKNEKGELLEGWWTGFRVNDANTWALHKAGKLPEFSIGGKATPVTV